jgi:hypothetical protein
VSGLFASLRRFFAGVAAASPPADPDVAVDRDAALRQWATELGVSEDVMQRLVEQRRALVYDVAADPRAWGFDLIERGGRRRDVATEFRSQTRLQGALAESFLAEHSALLKLVPDPLTLPDGTPLDEHLVRAARLEPEAAADIARQLRSTLQVRLGRPLEAEHVEHAVREAAWDHELDAARVTPDVLRALVQVIAA